MGDQEFDQQYAFFQEAWRLAEQAEREQRRRRRKLLTVCWWLHHARRCWACADRV